MSALLMLRSATVLHPPFVTCTLTVTDSGTAIVAVIRLSLTTIEHAKLLGNRNLVNLPNVADLVIRDSWFEGNTDNLVYFSSGTATIERSTFANNTGNTDGTLYFVYGTVSITDSTFSGNTGDLGAVVINNSTSTLTNNLLVANTGTSDHCHFSGAVMSDGGNLVFPADDAGTTCLFDAATDLASVDPLLEPLARNGAQIPTHALPADSPAVDSGVAAGCTPTDGRGIPRPQGNACDIGAFERE